MEEKRDIPYIAFESELARSERTVVRLWILCIILIILLVGSNVAWLWYENQFEDITQTVTQEVDGDNASNHFIGGDSYGEGETDRNDKN